MSWLEPGASIGSEPEAVKKRAVGASSAENRVEQLNHMILSIQNAQEIRQLKAASMLTYLVPTVLVEDALAINKQFGEKTKGQSGHKFGPPHVQTWRVFLKAIASQTVSSQKELSPVQTYLDNLNQYITSCEKAGITSGHLSISIFRMKVTREKTTAIVSYTLSPLMAPQDQHALVTAIHHLILLLGGEARAGPPPALQAERKMQTSIDSLKDQLKIKRAE